MSVEKTETWTQPGEGEGSLGYMLEVNIEMNVIKRCNFNEKGRKPELKRVKIH